MIRTERRTQTIRRGYRAPLGYRYCIGCASSRYSLLEPARVFDVDTSNLADRKCDGCERFPPDWEPIQVEVSVEVEYFRCRVF